MLKKFIYYFSPPPEIKTIKKQVSLFLAGQEGTTTDNITIIRYVEKVTIRLINKNKMEFIDKVSNIVEKCTTIMV